MMRVVRALKAPVVATSQDDAVFPVGRIFCVGRNYAAHAREMGMDERDPPFFFTKFPGSLVPSGGMIAYPRATEDFQFEGELVIAIGRDGVDLTPQEALSIIFGYAAGLDMTRRDLQMRSREQGRPWDTGKNFDESAPIGVIHPVSQVGHIALGSLVLRVNGDVRQQADIGDMIWSCAEIISHLSHYGPLRAGDLIYTGTPAGVGAVVPGDRISVDIEGLSTLEITVGPKGN